MEITRKLTRPDGTKVRVVAMLMGTASAPQYCFRLFVRKPRERNYSEIFWPHVPGPTITLAEKQEALMGVMSNYVTQEELHNIALELWQKIKPKLNSMKPKMQ